MKTSVIISAVLIGVSALAFAANEKPAVENASFDPGKFYGLIVNNNANIILSQGDKNSVRIEGDKLASKKIQTEIQNGALVINGGENESMSIYITVEDINMIEINGSGKIFGMGTLSSDILLLKVNGSGSMKLDVRTLKIAMIAKDKGKIIVSGSTGESFVKEFGNGKVFSDDLHSFSQVQESMSSTNKTEKAVQLQP